MKKMAWRTRIILLLAILLLGVTSIVIARRSAPSGPVFHQPLTVNAVRHIGDGTLIIEFTDASGAAFVYSKRLIPLRNPDGSFAPLRLYRGYYHNPNSVRLPHLGLEYRALYEALTQWRRDHPFSGAESARLDDTIFWANKFIIHIEQDMREHPDPE